MGPYNGGVRPGRERAVALPFRAPLDAAGLLAFLAARAAPGVEAVEAATYRRTLRLAGGPATIAVRIAPQEVRATVRVADVRDEAAALAAARRLCDLDADPRAIDAVLAADPVLRPLVLAAPGRRVPGAADPFELVVRAVLGQQVSVAAATALAGRLAADLGTPVATDEPGLARLFPSRAALAAAPPDAFPMPAARRRTLQALAAAPALDAATLAAIPGIGPWTLAYVAMRLGDRDAFLPTDLVARRALATLGLRGNAHERWRPYRAHALMHLWTLSSAG